MNWTWANVGLVAAGVLAITLGGLAIRHRERLFELIVEVNSRLYGDRTGERMRRVSSTQGVLVPGVFAIGIGALFVLFGIFGHPQ